MDNELNFLTMFKEQNNLFVEIEFIDPHFKKSTIYEFVSLKKALNLAIEKELFKTNNPYFFK